ncbi:MAG: hypothetical protein NVV73_08885 [Cellvibrionaceae bacterium]|nr:hypothetical protein [Cellvibrionaceae bacterium]
MNALELKIPPLVQVLIIAGCMGLVAAVSRDFLLPLAIRWWGALLLLGPGVFLVLAGVWSFSPSPHHGKPAAAGHSIFPGDLRRLPSQPQSYVRRISSLPVRLGGLSRQSLRAAWSGCVRLLYEPFSDYSGGARIGASFSARSMTPTAAWYAAGSDPFALGRRFAGNPLPVSASNK